MITKINDDGQFFGEAQKSLIGNINNHDQPFKYLSQHKHWQKPIIYFKIILLRKCLGHTCYVYAWLVYSSVGARQRSVTKARVSLWRTYSAYLLYSAPFSSSPADRVLSTVFIAWSSTSLSSVLSLCFHGWTPLS